MPENWAAKSAMDNNAETGSWRIVVHRMFKGLVALALVTALVRVAQAQGNPRGKAKLSFNGKSISVEYGQPSLRGRTIYEMLKALPANGVWRVGADTSTTFSTSGDLMFGEIKVPQGVYSLWARRDPDQTWKLVLNSQHGQSGTQHNPSLDVAAIPLKESRAAVPPDEVTISLSKSKMRGTLAIEWGELRLSAEFE